MSKERAYECFKPFGDAISSSSVSSDYSSSSSLEGPEVLETPAFAPSFEQYDLLMRSQPWSLHANFLYPMIPAMPAINGNNGPTQTINMPASCPRAGANTPAFIKCPDCVATFTRIQEWKRHARCVLYLPHFANSSRHFQDTFQDHHQMQRL